MKLNSFFMLSFLTLGLTSCAYLNGVKEAKETPQAPSGGTTIQVPASTPMNPNSIPASINTNAAKQISPATP